MELRAAQTTLRRQTDGVRQRDARPAVPRAILWQPSAKAPAERIRADASIRNGQTPCMRFVSCYGFLMITDTREAILSTPEIGADLRRAESWSKEHLIRIAVLRGCRHYGPLLSKPPSTSDDEGLSHEVLGVALLHGPRDVATFQVIRCGAMVLSDLENNPAVIRAAAEHFGVLDRVAHIARLALIADAHPAYWERLMRLLPRNASEDPFMPGLSRLTSETWIHPLSSRKMIRTWLRTSRA